MTLAISLGLVAHLGVAQPSAPKPVYFSLIVSYGEFGFDSSGGIPSVDIALNYINRSQILPGYQLMYEKPRNSKVGKILYHLSAHCVTVNHSVGHKYRFAVYTH